MSLPILLFSTLNTAIAEPTTDVGVFGSWQTLGFQWRYMAPTTTDSPSNLYPMGQRRSLCRFNGRTYLGL